MMWSGASEKKIRSAPQPFLPGISAAGAVLLLLHKFARLRTTLPVTIDWINELSAERYRPMLRLLDQEDFAFLRSQPGYTPALLAGLRRARVQVFRVYLREFTGDFARTCAAIKLLMLQSDCDRRDLAATLVRSQVAFATGMVAVHLRLALFACGLGTVNVTNLVKLFDAMRTELRQLTPAAMPAGA